MRVCPKCKFIDPPYWKHVKFSYFIDSCSLENFKIMNPKLAKKLVKERMVDDEDYVYRLMNNNFWVQRKAKVDYGDQSWSDKCEKHDPRLNWKWAKTDQQHDFHKDWFKHHPNQKKLLETPQKR